MPGPLDGVRVLELPAIGPVPFLGMLLADLGAEVVRIDKLSGGGPFDGLPAGPLGRGRRSIALDVRKPGGAEVVLRLIERSDALIEGFRPGVAERLGIGPDARARPQPEARLRPDDRLGPGRPARAPRAGHDITYLAITGLLHGIGPADGRPSRRSTTSPTSAAARCSWPPGCSPRCCTSAPAATGQVVDAAMTEGAAYLGSMTRTFLAMGGWKDERAANMLDGGAPNYRCYECADGRWVAVGALEPQFWAALVDDARTGEDAPSPYDPAQWDACARGAHRGVPDADPRRVGRRLRAARRLRGAGAHARGGAAPPAQRRPRARTPEVGDATLAAPAPKFSATPGATGELTEIGAETAAAARRARLRRRGCGRTPRRRNDRLTIRMLAA